MKKNYFLLCFLTLLFSCNKEYDLVDGVSGQSGMRMLTAEEMAVQQAVAFLNDVRPQTRGIAGLVGSVCPLTNAGDITTRSTGTGNDTLLYVVNFANNQGYAITSADANTGCEVYALVDEGTFVPGDSIENPGFKQYMDDLMSYVVSDMDIGSYSSPLFPIPAHDFWSIDTLYTPILTTKWGQGFPFNTYCYSSDNELSAAGCVAVAIGQILSVHQQPTSYNGHTYSWSDILTGYAPTNNSGQESVARLINDIGVLVLMDYSPTGSGALTSNVYICLDAFGYQSYEYYDGYDFGLCANSVHLGCPVYISGSRYDESQNRLLGHAWVVDGILVRHQLEQQIGDEIVPVDVQRYVHCNWGWNGNGNGYFYSGVFDVRNRVLDDNMQDPTSYYNVDRNYEYNHVMIYNISPRVLGPVDPGLF